MTAKMTGCNRVIHTVFSQGVMVVVRRA